MNSSRRLSKMTGIGSRISIRRGTVVSRYRRTTCSNRLTSIVDGALVTPSSLTKLSSALGGTPRRRSAKRVYKRGSSQSWTWPFSISAIILRFDSTVPERFSRPNLMKVSKCIYLIRLGEKTMRSWYRAETDLNHSNGKEHAGLVV